MSTIDKFDPRTTGRSKVMTVVTSSGSTYEVRCRRSPVGIVDLNGPKGRTGRHLIEGIVQVGNSMRIWQNGKEITTTRVVSITPAPAA
jgi:hypothetical protein